MEWSQLIISALSGILGAAVGGFATYKTTTKQFKFMTKQELQKQRRDDELYLKRKREEVYIKLYDFLMRLEKDIRIRKNTYMSEETKNYYNNLEMQTIWASNKVSDKFYDLCEALCQSANEYKKDANKAHNKNNKKILAFKDYIRKELSIKD